MEERNTPIERPPMLGFKQSKFDLSPLRRVPNRELFQLISTCSTRESPSKEGMTAVLVRR